MRISWLDNACQRARLLLAARAELGRQADPTRFATLTDLPSREGKLAIERFEQPGALERRIPTSPHSPAGANSRRPHRRGHKSIASTHVTDLALDVWVQADRLADPTRFATLTDLPSR